MKVLQINTFSYKAAGNIMMNLHNAMLEEGIDSYVAWGRGRKAENEHEYYMNDEFGVKFHGIYTRITDRHGFASKNATKNFIKWIDNINPDIVHLHCIHGYYINIEMLFSYIREKKIRVIWTQHDCWAFTGHCAYFDAIKCQKWREGCERCEQLNTYPASRILDSSKWNWNKRKELFSGLNITIVTPCNWLCNVMKDSFLGEYPIRVINNGIDTSIFKPTKSDFFNKYNIKNKKIILGVAGEWTERKGLCDFVELNRIMDKSIYKIVVVGVNDKQIDLLPPDIISIKRTENVEQLVKIYSSSFVFFNPTYEDNFPTTNLEALACGTPVITYRTGGSGESIVENVNGYIVEKGDIVGALRIINEKICGKSFDFNENKFSLEAMQRKYKELYYEKN